MADEEKKEERYKCLAIPIELYDKIEAVATNKRMETGENVTWSSDAKEVLEKHYR